MSETEEVSELMDFMQRFVDGTEDRMIELKSVEQEILLLTEQITTKDDHLRQLSAQRNGLHAKYQSMRNVQQDAAMKYLTDYIEMTTRHNQN